MPRRIRLKVAIVENDRTQREVSRFCDIPETRLSGIIGGGIRPTTSEEIRLSQFLERPREALFASVSATVEEDVVREAEKQQPTAAGTTSAT